MEIRNLKLKNWKNFRDVDVDLGSRVFIVGPNASGKSNFLDVFRFLRDLSKVGGGLQKAINDRGGLTKIRCLAARHPSTDVEIDITISDNIDTFWRYSIGITKEKAGLHRTLLAYERVWRNDEQLLNRPGDSDKKDTELLTETDLENKKTNVEFRELANHFTSTLYLHLIPQLIRHHREFIGFEVSDDPFGRNFLDRIAKTQERTRLARFKHIASALKIAVPQLTDLQFEKDEEGKPHLVANYDHWRDKGAKQREEQFSDGTLRLIGLLWALLDGDSLLLLEEPELSLNAAIVEKLPELIYVILKSMRKKRQVILTTHSFDLLSDRSISGDEVLLLVPDKEGTQTSTISSKEDARILLENGFSVGEVIKPRLKPKNLDQLTFDFQ